MRRLVGDLEGDGLYDDVTQLWCGVFKDLDTGEVFRFHQGSHTDWVSSMLNFLSTSSMLVFHNGTGYDFPVLEKLYGWEYKGRKRDTLIMSRLMYPNITLPPHAPSELWARPHSIEAWGFRVGKYKPEHEDWSHFSPAMLRRCEEDVNIGCEVYARMLRKSQKEGWGNAVSLTCKLFEILWKQEQYGWLVDQNQLHKSLRVLNKWVERIDKVVTPKLPTVLVIEEDRHPVKSRASLGVYKYVKSPFVKSGAYHANTAKWMEASGLKGRCVCGPYSRVSFRKTDLNSNEETKDFLLKEGWIPDEWNISKQTGERTSPKLSYKDSFIGIKGKLGSLVARRVQCKHREATLNGFVKRLRPDGRLSARVTGIAATGRMKHSNIVNIPNAEAFFGKWMRKIFIAPKGRVIVGTDAASCQNRCLAARVNNAWFTDILLNGKKEDQSTIHHINAKSITEATHIHCSYGQAKTSQYGWMFGASDNKLGSLFGHGKALGATIRQALLDNAPGLETILDNLKAEFRATAKKEVNRWGGVDYSKGKVTGLDGRPIHIPSEHALLVYMLQSDEAIIMATAYVLTYQRLIAKGFKWGDDFAIVAFMHDETQIECREEVAQDVAAVAEQAIADAGAFYKSPCPHQGEADIGLNWYETH